MGKYSKKSSFRHKGLVVCIVLAVVLVLLIALVLRGLFTGSAPDTAGDRSPLKELDVESVTEQEDSVLVTTTYGTVRYPFAFSDIMCVEAETFDDHAVLMFNAIIDGVLVKLYALQFNGTEGIPVGTLEVDGEEYAVTSLFYNENRISDNNMATFYAVQETFNDVLVSLSENEGFTVSD